MDSLFAKIAGTVILLFGWLAITVLYLAFFAGSFDFWQKLAIFIASGAIVLAALALLWIRWTIK
jgi:hypothetical protein